MGHLCVAGDGHYFPALLPGNADGNVIDVSSCGIAQRVKFLGLAGAA